MYIKQRIAHLLKLRLGFYFQKEVDERILDKSFRVVEGSIRTEDYDEAWLLSLGLHSKIVFDIGCNIGQSSLLFLYSHSLEQILLVDPNPEALSVAAKNIIINNMSHKARFCSFFVGDRCGNTIKLYTTGYGAAGSMFGGHAKTASHIGAFIYARTVTIDSLSDQYGLIPDLVKIDVEGAENLVLQGGENLASKMKTKFFVEMHSNPELTMRENAESTIRWCKKNSYRAWYLKDKTELTSPSQIENRGRCHLLLLPNEMPFPEYLMSLEQGAPLDKVVKVDDLLLVSGTYRPPSLAHDS